MAACRCGNTNNAQGNCDGSHANIKKEEEKK
jgi:CDGSH-type Zn-finger protein